VRRPFQERREPIPRGSANHRLHPFRNNARDQSSDRLSPVLYRSTRGFPGDIAHTRMTRADRRSPGRLLPVLRGLLVADVLVAALAGQGDLAAAFFQAGGAVGFEFVDAAWAGDALAVVGGREVVAA